MTHEQIDRIVRQANPVPDPTTLEPIDASVLVLDQQRRTEMQTNDQVEVDLKPQRPVRGVLVGIAATAAVVIGGLILFQPRDPAPAATATEVAAEFVEAYANGDIDTAASYLTADANLTEFDGSVERMGLVARWNEASGFKVLPDSCEERSTSAAGASVRCPYDYHAIRSDEIGLGPYGGSWIDLTVRDGKIVSASGSISFIENHFSEEMWEPFADWVAETYPDDVPVMYTGSDQSMNKLTDESIALWEQRTREYVEHVRTSS